MKTALLALLLTVPVAFAGTSKPPTPSPRTISRTVTAASLIRVSSTNQAFDFFRPWMKKAPTVRRGLGVVVEGGHLIVSAELLTNHTYVELENPDTAKKSAAEVVLVDYDCNLALLKPTQADFLKDAVPLSIAPATKVGERIELLQLEATGDVAQTPAVLTTIMVAPYPQDNVSLLTYRASCALQGRDGSFTIPAVRDRKLVGLVMRYDGRNQTADIIPSPVIDRFLKDAQGPSYGGIPRVSIAFSSLRDPQFRKYIGLLEDGGVYVTEVRPGGAGEKSGLLKGDVILRVAGKAIDPDGNYEDPQFGRIAFSHLTSSAKVGETVDFEVFREGKNVNIPVTLEPQRKDQVISEPYVYDQQPAYYILGGLVFTELSRSYLEEWGNEWVKNAPQKLVALDAFQNEQPTDRGKIVFLSQVLPTATTLGYEDLEHMVVSKVNGTPIRSLHDLIEAAKHPENGFQKIEFDADPPVIYLDATEAEKSGEQIKQEYGIPELQHLN